MAKKLWKILGLNIFYLFPTAGFAFAQLNLSRFTCLEAFVSALVTLILGAVGVVALFAIVLGGFHYMTSGGDKYKIQDAQRTLTGGIVGLVLSLLAFLIVDVIFRIFAGESFVAPTC